jgi:hypothetical protein
MKYNISVFSPCKDGSNYYNSFKSFSEFWENCNRGDWMLWVSGKLKVSKRKLTLAKGRCAETVINLMHDERSKRAVFAAIKYGNGEIGDSELAATAIAADAAIAAAIAAAADAATAIAAAADAAADAATARSKNRQQTADICRLVLTDEIKTILGKSFYGTD